MRMRQGEDPAGHTENARSIASQLRGEGVRAIALTFVDNAGITRVKTIPVDRLPDAVSEGVGMSPVFDFFLFDDSISPEASPTGDLRLVPDLRQVTAMPAAARWAWAPVTRLTQDGTPHPGCQRFFVRRMVDVAHERSLDVMMGFELEWVVGNEDDQGRFVPATRGPGYGMGRLAELSDYIAELHECLAAQSVDVLQIHPEYAPGQFECSVAPTGPVEAADNFVLLRETIRALTNSYGMRASFAPVVTPGGVGNGAHLHLSLWQGQRNLLSAGNGPYGMTERGQSFLASVLAHLPSLVAVGAPSVASYLRLLPSRWAGAYQCWGRENREAALRLITGSVNERESIANAEVKCFDGAANPYLVAGAVLAVGVDGLDSGRCLPRETTVDPSRLSDSERADLSLQRLPQDLSQAVEHMSNSELLSHAMGPPLFDAFLAVRRAEIASLSGATDEEIVTATRWRY